MSKAWWEHYSHPADMGVRGFGPTKEQAFEQAALGLTAVIADLDRIEPEEHIDIRCEADDDELLLAAWLNKLLFEMAMRRMLFSKFDVGFEAGHLRAKAWGEKLDIQKHRPTVEVKAATYADLKVQRDENGAWMAQCIVDV